MSTLSPKAIKAAEILSLEAYRLGSGMTVSADPYIARALTHPDVLTALRALLAEQEARPDLGRIYDEAAAEAKDYPCQWDWPSRCCDVCPITPADPACPHHPQACDSCGRDCDLADPEGDGRR